MLMFREIVTRKQGLRFTSFKSGMGNIRPVDDFRLARQ